MGRGTGATLARWRGSAHTRETVRPATPFWQRVAAKLLFIMIYAISVKGSSVFGNVRSVGCQVAQVLRGLAAECLMIKMARTDQYAHV